MGFSLYKDEIGVHGKSLSRLQQTLKKTLWFYETLNRFKGTTFTPHFRFQGMLGKYFR